MYYKILKCILLLCILCANLHAQPILPYTASADNVFNPLDKSYITTGILYDRVFPFANVDDYVGDVNSTDAYQVYCHYKSCARRLEGCENYSNST